MRDNEASYTALSVAYMRAYHSRYADGKIFDDFLAYDLIPEDKLKQIEQHLISCNKHLNNSEDSESHFDQTITSDFFLQGLNSVVSRAKYAEDTLEEAVRQGVKQYIILGAGMDTFAFRRPDLMEQLEVFELDHPATQEFKLHRLTELGWEYPVNLHFIPIDFTKEKLETALTKSLAYDLEAKSLFSWFGVTPYLTQEEVLTTLRSIANVAPSGSTVVFDYTDIDAFKPEKLSQRMKESMEFLEKVGEPMKAGGFNPSNLVEDLASLGFNLKENLSPTDIKETYLKGSMDKSAFEYVHFASAVIDKT
jgi:methyltransferase (TIGR00027 family)